MLGLPFASGDSGAGGGVCHGNPAGYAAHYFYVPDECSVSKFSTLVCKMCILLYSKERQNNKINVILTD